MSSGLPEINISMISFSGGVGRTLLSSCISAAFSANGYKVALVDLSRQHFTPYYMGLPALVNFEKSCGSYAMTRWGDLFVFKPSSSHDDVAEKISGYQVGIYDFPIGVPFGWDNLLESSYKVIVVNHDIRTLRETKNQIEQCSLSNYYVMANKVPAHSINSYKYVVSDILDVMPIAEIPFDSAVEAYVENFAPVSNYSILINDSICKLAETFKQLRR